MATGFDTNFSQALQRMQEDAAAQFGANALGISSGFRSPETQAQIIANNWHKFDLDPAAKSRWLSDVKLLGPIEAGNRWESVFTNARRTASDGKGSPFRNWIGLPGRSYHQKGFAADLKYASPAVRDWAHKNAAQYGLNFPLSNENWHIELMGARSGKTPTQTRVSTKDATMTPTAGTDVVDQMKEAPGGIRGVLDFATERNPETGLSRFQQFAAALDPLILPEMRAGAAIRAAGAERVKTAKVNKTIEWLKNNGYAEIAAALEINPEGAANVMSSILSEKMKGPETKVVDGKLINVKTGEVVYQEDAEKLKTLDDKQVTIVRNLSNDLLKSYKIYDEVANGYGLIASAIKNKSGVDDYVLTVAFAKILDPESVVRESEQAAVARSGGAIDAFVKDVQNFIAGTGSLPESVRSRISSTAQQRAKFYFDKAKGEYDRAVRTAKYSGINESVINDVIPKPTPMPSIQPISDQPTTPPPTTKNDTRTQSAKDAGVSVQEWNAMSAEDKALFP